MSRDRIEIHGAPDILFARRQAVEAAIDAGFSRTAAEEVALAVQELCTNMIRYAGKGRLEINGIRKESRVGLQVTASDNGPGIHDVDRAVQDGFSSSGSLGYGLGSVYRMMSGVEIRSPLSRGRGSRIECVRWLPRKSPAAGGSLLDCGAATRAYPGMKQNGDAFVLKRSGDFLLAAVIDGLGHGTFAHRAAQTARLHVETFAERPLTEIFRNTERFCRPTRGVVMAIARVEWPRETLRFAGIGNIAVRLHGAPKDQSLYQLRGIVGGGAPNAREVSMPWPRGGVLVMHSDGLSSRWRWADHQHLLERSATEMAGAMLRTLAKDNDDATVVVVKSRKRISPPSTSDR